jgi:hypothetical protein
MPTASAFNRPTDLPHHEMGVSYLLEVRKNILYISDRMLGESPSIRRSDGDRKTHGA